MIRRIVHGVLGLVVLSLAATARAEVGPEGYRLPLVEPYEIYRAPLPVPPEQRDQACRLVEIFPGPDSAYATLLDGVERVAMRNRVIFGRARGGYFILDGRTTDTGPTTFPSSEAWQAELERMGIPRPDELQTPDALAARLAPQVLRPWHYRVMQGRWGMTDQAWAILLQAASLPVAVAIGWFVRAARFRFALALGLGLCVNAVARLYLADDVLVALIGFVAFPLLLIFAAAFGHAGRRRIMGHPAPPQVDPVAPTTASAMPHK